MGTCTISRLINVIHESEIDNLAMPWLTAMLVQLLSCQLGMVVPSPEGVETPEEGACGGSPEVNINELVMVWESVHLGPFQTEIIEGCVKPLLGSTSYVMITPLKVEGWQFETKPLPLGLHILHAYTHLKNGSGRGSLVVRNVSDSQIFLKKGVPVAQVVSTTLVSPTELSLEIEATLGEESKPEPLSVAMRQEKLLEKLNLDGLAHWSPENAVAVRELVLAYHDVFTLESNELGCTSTIEHEIHIENEEPFKERFWHIPPPLLEEVHPSLRDMLESEAIHPSQYPWCNMVVLVQKDSTLCFCVDFRHLNVCTKKDSYPLPRIQEVLESMVGLAHFSSMDFKSSFCQIKMAPGSQQYTAFTVGNLGFYEFTRMPIGLCNALAMFQHLMQNTLGELNLTYCVICLDDVIVFGRTEEEHLEQLCVVFKRFRKFNLKLKPS